MPVDVALAFERAACKGMDEDMFFPERGERSYVDGKRVCRECPIITTCRNWSLSKPEPYGLWGGMTPQERRQMAE